MSGPDVAHGVVSCFAMVLTTCSNLAQTSRHLAEFWMIEPEMAFADLDVLSSSLASFFSSFSFSLPFFDFPPSLSRVFTHATALSLMLALSAGFF